MIAPNAWRTRETLDGKEKLDEWFYATNPRYIEVHKEWKWEAVYKEFPVKNDDATR